MDKNKTTIIGAGLTGLVAAYRLSQKGSKVTIYEKSGDMGGLMGGFNIGDVTLEKTYHHIFKTDKFIIDLIRELGLENKLKWYPEKTALYYENIMYPFMGVMDLLKFKPLDMVSKIRLGLVKIRLEHDNDWEKYNRVTAVEWMNKWCGEKAYKVVWEPLLKGKFHDKYKEISMAWLWARIHTRVNSQGQLGYLDGGFRQITDELAKRILKNGGKIKLNTEFNPSKSPFNKGDLKIIYTGPSDVIDYLGAINVVFTSKQNLSPYYWHNINDVNSPFLAFIQHTNLVGIANYGGRNVYYLGTYVPHDHKYFGKDDKIVIKDFFDYLKKIFPEFNEKEVEKTFVFKFKYAQHIVRVNYKVSNPSPFQGAPLDRGATKGFYLANFAQIFPEDRGMNFAVREGEKAANLMLD